MLFWAKNVSANLYEACKRDIQKYCQVYSSERDILFCLKKISNLLEAPSCFNYVATEVNKLLKKQAEEERQRKRPPEVKKPVEATTPQIIKSEQEILNEKRYKERLAKCNKEWPNEEDFWNRKEQVCEDYAKMNPDFETSNCISDLSVKKKNAEERFSYEAFIYQKCTESLNKDTEWRKCFKQNKITTPDYFANFLKCNPKIRSCLNNLNSKYSAQKDSKISDYYYQHCSFRYEEPQYSEESLSCIASMARRGNQYISNVSDVASFCSDNIKPCIDFIIKENKITNLTFDEHRIIDKVCFLRLQEETDLKTAQCYYKTQKEFKLPTSELSPFCQETSNEGRNCISLAVKQGISLEDAKNKICLVNSPIMQKCLMHYLTHQDEPPYATNRGDASARAFWYCSLEDQAGQSCFLNKIEKEQSSTDQDFRKIASVCRKLHANFNQCYEDFVRQFDFQINRFGSRKEIGLQLCEIPIEEMRLCILDILIDPEILITESTFFTPKPAIDYSFDKTYDFCHSKVLKKLFADMRDNGQKWACRSEPFENLSLEDQNKKCVEITDSPSCNKFKLKIVPNISDYNLKPICKRMTKKYFLRRGPLYLECLKRNLPN